jgi:hypothetical protein
VGGPSLQRLTQQDSAPCVWLAVETDAVKTAFGISLTVLDKSDSAGSTGFTLDGIRFTVTAQELVTGS